jgi:hypothetical protein
MAEVAAAKPEKGRECLNLKPPPQRRSNGVEPGCRASGSISPTRRAATRPSKGRRIDGGLAATVDFPVIFCRARLRMGSTLKKIVFLAIAAFLVERTLGIMEFLLRVEPGQPQASSFRPAPCWAIGITPSAGPMRWNACIPCWACLISGPC